MPEWSNLTWGQSLWGDNVSPQTSAMQTVYGGYMPWQAEQMQAAERESILHIYALSDPPDLVVQAEIFGIDQNASLTKQIREGIVEEQILSITISDPGWAEYYISGPGRPFLQTFRYIKAEQHTNTESHTIVAPIGLFRISGLPKSNDDGSGVSATWDAEDWLASNLRTPFRDGVNPYDILVKNFEGSVDYNNLPASPTTPQGISNERLQLGHSVFGEASNWFHNFFGYVWNFMYDLTNGHFIVDHSVVLAAQKSSKIKVGSPEIKGFWIPTVGSESTGSVTEMMTYLQEGDPAQKFGIYSFPEGPSAIAYLKDLLSQDGLLNSHSGVKGTYFVYDRNGDLHWRRWGGIVNPDGLIFTCDGDAQGNVSIPVESLSISIKEPEFNHYIVQGTDVQFKSPTTVDGTPVDGVTVIESPVLDPPEGSGLSIYGQLLSGFAWTEESSLGYGPLDYNNPIAIPPEGVDHVFPFMETYNASNGQRPFNPDFTVAPAGSEVRATFYGNSEPDPLAFGAEQRAVGGLEIARNNTMITYNLRSESSETIYLSAWHLYGTVWAPESLWTAPGQTDFTDDDKWNNAIGFYDSTFGLKTYEDLTLHTNWYTHPGLRDRIIFLFLGDEYVYLVTPANFTDPPLDPRVVSRELATAAKEMVENAKRFYAGPACELTIGLDSAFSFVELGTTMRIQYPPQRIDGYFQLMTVNMPFNEQPQQWTLQWVEDA